MNLPEDFKLRMQQLLGTEYEDFLSGYEQEKKQGLRVNTAKISVEDFLKLTPFQLTPIPWTDNGFYYKAEDGVTKHPHYYAGLYYVQEPSAMTPASRLPVEQGEMVLDLCAAPGGKSTELASKLKGSGMLVANDISVSRARALLKNLERFGAANICVTGESPQQLRQAFGCAFDKILVDAPCSGEGMFRKDPSLITSWMERGPEDYAPLQKEILSTAVDMLKPGGMLIYSTCTFAPEEDEYVILDILDQHPDLVMEVPQWYEGFSMGRSRDDLGVNLQTEVSIEKTPAGDTECVMGENADRYRPDCCIRIWPHHMDGEGHFVALLRKLPIEEVDCCQAKEEFGAENFVYEERKISAQRTEMNRYEIGSGIKKQIVKIGDSAVVLGTGFSSASAGRIGKTDKFEKKSGNKRGKTERPERKGSAVTGVPQNGLSEEAAAFLGKIRGTLMQKGNEDHQQELIRMGEDLYLLPAGVKVPKLRYLRSGLLLGTEKKGRFEPSQALAMAMTKSSWENILDLPADHPCIMHYLKGDTIEVPEDTACENGWVLICCDGYPLGWGKCTNGTIKNKYQPGWRML